MSTTLVKYRTSDVPFDQHAAVPAIYITDLIDWLNLTESAAIASVTYDTDHPFDAPEEWPSHSRCSHYSLLSDIMAGVR